MAGNSKGKIRAGIMALLQALSMLCLVSAVPAETAAPVSVETAVCLECHETLHPGIVRDWRKSRHALTTPGDALRKEGQGIQYTGAPTVQGKCRGVRGMPHHEGRLPRRFFRSQRFPGTPCGNACGLRRLPRARACPVRPEPHGLRPDQFATWIWCSRSTGRLPGTGPGFPSPGPNGKRIGTPVLSATAPSWK